MSRFHVRERMTAAAQRALRARQHADGTRVELRSASNPEFVLLLHITPDTLDGGFIAEVEGFPGCVSQGESPREAIDNVIQALGEVLTASAEDALSRHDTTDDHGGGFKLAVPVG